jgi:hypothetical protein
VDTPAAPVRFARGGVKSRRCRVKNAPRAFSGAGLGASLQVVDEDRWLAVGTGSVVAVVVAAALVPLRDWLGAADVALARAPRRIAVALVDELAVAAARTTPLRPLA